MSKPKLLLADDSITIQKVVNLTFADQGMDVYPFSDGDKAIELFDEIKPDIVLADVHMPGINGYQLCELLKSDAGSKDIPVVLLVGSFEPFDSEEAQRVGASAHLTKPFSSIAQLISTVEGLLNKPATVTEPAAADDLSPQEYQPDTSDIDSLYKQSFMETVELPKNGEQELEFQTDEIDDEMIQTSYAHSHAEPVADEPIYSADEIDEPVHHLGELEPTVYVEPPPQVEMHREHQIAAPKDQELYRAQPQPELASGEQHESSVPAEIEVQEFDGAIDESPTAAEFQTEAEYTTEPEFRYEEEADAGPSEQTDLVEQYEESRASDAVAAGSAGESDPFASVADEPTVDADAFHADTVKFAFDDLDLLELPESPASRAVEYTVPGAPAANGRQAVSLSAELIELIVQKVIERLGKDQ